MEKSVTKTLSTRRQCVTSAVAAFTILPRHVLGGRGQKAPSDKLNIAGVGVGSMGAAYLRGCESENIVALADVDYNFAAKTFARYPNAKTYKDFRVMLEKEKGIDAVTIGTPDHTHAVVAAAAIALGKHVYCAKPLCRTIYEVRTVTKAARDAQVATQMSTQSAASEAACATKEMLSSGIIGNVREVHMSSDRPIWPQGLARPESEPAPPGLDWDLWIGPSPFRPYSPFYHPFNHRGWYDFGTGALGDMALHDWHVFWDALELKYPSRISATVALATEATRVVMPNGVVRMRAKKVKYPESFPHAEVVTFEFPERGGMPPLRLIWYDGGLLPPRPLGLDPAAPAPARYYVGDKGVLIPPAPWDEFPAGAVPGFTVLVNGKRTEFEPPRKTIPRTIGHYKEWIATAKGGKPANCNFDYACLFAETALLGVIAARTGRDLSYDAENARFTNCPDANEYVNPPYRAGWSL
ncbi:MAG: Gfo/Idh/MocA family oxidoreductase [Acidobacteriales bacterium]|nr:Gfo/Idh/MocA family oxidoreductase [Terriglobales bacterium]